MKMHLCQTHEVFNQASAFENVNLFTCDLALREALVREGGEHAGAALAALGAQPQCLSWAVWPTPAPRR